MAETTKSQNDYFVASFGERNQVKAGINALQVGGETSGSVFQAMPIGTSSAGTAVLVDLISAEAVTVNVGTVGINGFTGTAGTATQTKLVSTSAGALTTSGTVTGVGGGNIDGIGTVTALAAGTIVAGSIDVTAIGGTIGNLDDGTISVVKDGTISAVTSVTNVAGGSVVVDNLAGGTVSQVLNVQDGTVDVHVTPRADYFGSVATANSTASVIALGSVAGSAYYITDMVVTSSVANTITVGDGTVTIPLAQFYLGGAAQFSSNFNTPLVTTAGSPIMLDLGVVGSAAVTLTGYID